MNAKIHQQRATYADLEALPEGMIGELIDGELLAVPRPSPEHGLRTTEMLTDLGPPFRRGKGGPGGWLFIVEPELRFGDDVLVPDVAGWRVESLDELERVSVAITTVPDWLAEVESPSTALWDQQRKLPAYYRAGVEFVWFVQPLSRVITVLKQGPESWYLMGAFGKEQAARIEPFDAVPLEVRRWWSVPYDA